MPNIKPISDLHHDTRVLNEVAMDAPVFLTKNGRGKYVIMELQAYEKAMATIKLIDALTAGRASGEQNGWLTAEEVKLHLKLARERRATQPRQCE